MEYHEVVNTLEGLRRLRPKLGTGTTASLLDYLDTDPETMTAVQVAGSNGKGSTARLLERILRETGLTVGLYTSPDLNGLRERIRVCGQKIPKPEVVRYVEEVWPFVVEQHVEGNAPTFFEVTTALALWYFDRQDVDVAVLEVGIGGRYDSTSVVDPVAAAVTSVSLEHTDILGETVEAIARDKAHVAPEDAPLVTGATGSALEEIRKQTDVVTVGNEGPSSDDPGETASRDESASSVDVLAREREMVSLAESSLSLVGPDWEIETATPLLGQHQAVNAGIAAALARQAADVSEDDIAAGIRNVYCPGRFEVMDDAPLVVLDGAHNPDACAKLATVMERFDYETLDVVFGAMRDKDHREMLRRLPDADRVSLAAPDVDRAQDTDTLASVVGRETDATREQFDSVLGALEEALRSADESDCVLVTGSLYAISEARDRWTRAPTAVRTHSTQQVRSVMASADVPDDTQRQYVEQGVMRTVRFHTRRSTADRLKERMFSLGGTCTVSGIRAATQHVEVVLTGTIEQFKRLIRELRGCAGELRHLARQLTTRLEIGTEPVPTEYPWADRTAVMGILNVTPDSFHDGGEYTAVEDAVARAEEMVAAGADVVDVGGESTRPGATPVPATEECERVVPVLERLADLDAMVSIDTRKPAVAEAALAAGADMVNDVSGLADASMRHAVAESGAPVIVMHSLSAPVDPDQHYEYGDVVADIREDLTERLLLAERAGIDREQLLVDPGLGFGKRSAESFELLDRLDEFKALGTPVVVGHSQKSMFADLTGDADDRLCPTVVATALAADRGASIVRVHDVAENVAAIRTVRATTERALERSWSG